MRLVAIKCKHLSYFSINSICRIIADNKIFRAVRYPPQHPGFVDKDLTPGSLLERYPCPGDLDQDGMVSGSDLTVILSQWGCRGEQCEGDLNDDGVINGADLTVILSNWGSCG